VGIGLTLQQVEGWQGQYHRMLRWPRRVIGAANGEPSADELDYLLAFFESAHHLRDWLARTGAVSIAELESFAASHVEIGICRDIANGFKHHSISRQSIGVPGEDLSRRLTHRWVSVRDPVCSFSDFRTNG
jgi:hypothetical protein